MALQVHLREGRRIRAGEEGIRLGVPRAGAVDELLCELAGALEEPAVGSEAREAEVAEARLARAEELALSAKLQVALGELEAVARLHQGLEARLEALVETTDGFELAERDWELRGEGQLLGTRQSGFGDLRFTRLRADRALLERARDLARRLVTEPGPWQDEADEILSSADPTNLA